MHICTALTISMGIEIVKDCKLEEVRTVGSNIIENDLINFKISLVHMIWDILMNFVGY